MDLIYWRVCPGMSALNKANDNLSLQRAVIFGAGKAGESAFENLRENYDIVSFIDNDVEKQGTTLLGLPIHSVTDVQNDGSVILIASEFFEQIRSQLLLSSSIAPDRIQGIPARLLKPMAFENDKDSLGVSILKSICSCFETSGVNYHVDAGTLLGLYRDGQLIPWDDDLDIAINAEHLENIDALIPSVLEQLESLTSLPWEASKHISSHTFGNVPNGAVRSYKLFSTASRNIPSIDFFIKYVKHEFSDYCLASRGIRMPAHCSRNTKLFQVGENYWRVPSATEVYLACHYGESWHLPNPDWSLQDLDNTEVFGV